MVTDVLRTQKHTVSKGLEKYAWLDQPGDRLQSKAADGFHFLTDFTQLRNPIAIEIQALKTSEILGARVFAMGRAERFPDRLPNAVLQFRVWRIWNWIAWPVVRRDLRDGIAPRSIRGIAKTWVVWIKLYKTDLDVIL